MITMNNTQDFTLQVNHSYPVSRERVFNAWTNSEELAKWWGPEGYTTTIEEMNVEVDGKYKFSMHSPDGHTHVLTGQYVEIVPNEKLVFTWKWENGEIEFPTTKVTIDFVKQGDATEVVVTHSDLPSEEAAKNHNFGWTSSLEVNLKQFFV
ncbi:SRPBCC domain-containing protein [Fictibacillus nanhaiensis]|uniref:SRPBCC family protein n=1 Tax=Fictibacillus nanhaiensis TaxID=742169 RepID=UPI001C972C0B|nr:SRPBCC domain-containing protein [Fictibacillus nanhaiensis]MBY6036615.1 SRPBCC domain-containing protein [Fictibacillus nanhaiensis]